MSNTLGKILPSKDWVPTLPSTSITATSTTTATDWSLLLGAGFIHHKRSPT
jgi:hypothetical protein